MSKASRNDDSSNINRNNDDNSNDEFINIVITNSIIAK